MSYNQSMKHSRNHRKDRFTQQCGGPTVDAFARKQDKVEAVIDALPILDKLESWRRERKYRDPITVDFAYRYAAHVVAGSAGYVGRPSWEKALKSTTATEELPKGKLNVLLTLMRLDARRIKCIQEKEFHPDSTVDYEIRFACAMIAQAAGFKNRNAWTAALANNEMTTYYRDLHDPNYPQQCW